MMLNAVARHRVKVLSRGLCGIRHRIEGVSLKRAPIPVQHVNQSGAISIER
jgi:hypothetical protein